MSTKCVPNAKWSLQRLGDFCVSRSNRLAEDAWWIGKAISLAKAKTKHGEFGEWKKKHGFSDAIASRYMRLAKQFESPEQMEGRKITEVLLAEGILPAARPKESVAQSKKSAAPKQHSGSFPWAVAETDDEPIQEIPESDSADETPTIPIPSLLSKLHYDLNMSLPNQVAGLHLTVRAILSHPKEERDAVWPVDRLAVIKTAVKDLRAALEELEKEIPYAAEVRKLSA